MKIVDIILKFINTIVTIASIVETGNDMHEAYIKSKNDKEIDFADIISDVPTVERALDAAKQEFLNLRDLEVVSDEDKQRIVSAIQNIRGIDYEERKDLEQNIILLLDKMNQQIVSHMTMDGKVLVKLIKESERSRDSLEQEMLEALQRIEKIINPQSQAENQNEEYITLTREKFESRVPDHYMQRYVGQAEEILGKDDRYLSALKPLRKSLIEIVYQEYQVVLLGQAGSGKTTELEKLTCELCMQGVAPIYISLNTYDNEPIEELIEKWMCGYVIEDYVLILDGYDEIADISGFQRKLNSYVQRNPKQKIILSTRNNFYHLSREKEQNGSLISFKEYTIFPILQEDISDYLKKEQVDEKQFWKQVYAKKLTEQVKVPFFFIHLVEIFEKNGCLPELRELMPQLMELSMDRDELKFDQKEDLELKEKYIIETLQKLAIIMQLKKVKQLTNEEVTEFITQEEIRIVRFSGIWKKTSDNNWQFTHNNFREYLTAEYLMKLPVETILMIVTYEKNRNRIKESWYNVLSFAGLLDETGEINQWVLNHDPSILFQYEDGRLPEEEKQKLFIAVFEKINEDYTWISWRSDTDVLANMAHDCESIKYLLNVLEKPKHDRCRDNAMLLLTQMDDYCGLEETARVIFTDLIFDERVKPYIRKNLLEALAIGSLYSEPVENEIFGSLTDIAALSDDVVYGMVMFLNYSGRSNYHVQCLMNCYLEYYEKHDGFSIEYTAKELLGTITGYQAIHELLTFITGIKEDEQDDVLYHISDIWVKLESQIAYIYEDENAEILKDTEVLFDKAALCYEENIMQSMIWFWKKENMLSRERDMITQTYGDDIILDRFKDFAYPEYDEESREERRKQLEEKNKTERQNYFDALFEKEKFQNLVDEFVQIMGAELTYREVKWNNVYYSTEREDLRQLVFIFNNVEFLDEKVINFTENVDWEYFSISKIYEMISNREVTVSEQQLDYIKAYVQKQLPLIQWNSELRSSKDGTTNITWRIIYVCYFIVKFNIAVPKEFVRNMIIFPEMFLRKINEKNADGEACNLENYICKNLSEHEIVVQIRKIAEKQILWGTLADRLIEWCDKYEVDIAKETAERIFSDVECKEYDRRKCFSYLQKIMSGEDMLDKYLDKADADMLDIFAEKAMEINSEALNNKLFEAAQKSEDKMKYLKTLISVYPQKALPLYYKLACEKNEVPDYSADNSIADITEAIADVNTPEHLDILMKLLELCFQDGFKDAETFGLYSSICKALRNIAVDNAELVLDQLNAVCRNTDNRNVKGYCNNMILDIEKQYYEQLDTPWTNGKIMKFIGI